MRKFGLIGYPLGHSFSGNYFREKFINESISDCAYSNYEIDSISRLADILKDPELEGLNVTIPYKESVIPFLARKDAVVSAIGASNCIRISKGELTGFNTDVIGFENALTGKTAVADRYALILGTGGSSKAVGWVLQQKGIRFFFVSRNHTGKADQLLYSELTEEIMRKHTLIINTTPLGMFPHVNACPPIPYQFVGTSHYLFDLVYNPSKTLFLEKGESAGARIKNGADMLTIQAEASWDIWNGRAARYLPQSPH